MSKNIKAVVEEIIKPIIEQMGYIYIETDYSKQGKDYILTVYVDKPDGITLEDCEKVSRTIEPYLDEADPIEQSYYLSVSSPGLDRPLKNAYDFKSTLNENIDVKLYKPFRGKKEFIGQLINYDNNGFTIVTDEEEINFTYDEVAKASRYFDC